MSGILIIVSLAILALAARGLVTGLRRNLYQYKNARRLGLMIFLCVFLVLNIVNYIGDLKKGYPPSFRIMAMDVKESVGLFTLYMFPVVFVTSVLVTVSNLVLLLREGQSWKNMLGLILGGSI